MPKWPCSIAERYNFDDSGDVPKTEVAYRTPKTLIQPRRFYFRA